MNLFRPTKRDLQQLQMFVDKNVTEQEIQKLLIVSLPEFEKWKKNPEVVKILNSRPVPHESKATVFHPEFADKVEVAFECDMIKYYRFIDQYAMPVGRYKYIYATLREVDLRMDLETLKMYVSELKKALNGEKKQVDLGLAWETLFNIETRLSLAFEPEGVKKLASIVYFTDDEILSTWNKEEGKKKVDFWNQHNCLDFFLTRPISELIKLNDSTITSLEAYLSQVYPILEELKPEVPIPS